MSSATPSIAISQLSIADIKNTRIALNTLLDSSGASTVSLQSDQLLSTLKSVQDSACQQYRKTPPDSIYALDRMGEISNTASSLHSRLRASSEQCPDSTNLKLRSSWYSPSRLTEWYAQRPLRQCEKESRTFLTETIPEKIESCAWHLRSQCSALMPSLQEEMQGKWTSPHCVQELDDLLKLVRQCEVRG